MNIHPAEFYRRKTQEYIETARELRNRNRKMKRWTRQAQQREELIPVYVEMARDSNHQYIQWRKVAN